MLNIIFHKDFYSSSYSEDAAAVPGRMESIINYINDNTDYAIVTPSPAEVRDILAVHTQDRFDEVMSNQPLFHTAMLSAGGAIKASQYAMQGIPAFAAIRPPGHHAGIKSGWGYCHFCNMAVALVKLFNEGRIESAFVLDFDAHTGDGTIECLKNHKSVKILNPMAENSKEYLERIDAYSKDIEQADVIAVCAGFDSYELDLGKKLSTFDFFTIGRMMKQLSLKLCKGKRFAILEGGYYLPDLGKNVVSFCDGFE